MISTHILEECGSKTAAAVGHVNGVDDAKRTYGADHTLFVLF